MATDYGVDVDGVTDLPDPEALVSGEENLAHALARRLLQPPDAMEEIGDTGEPYDCLDLREELGARQQPGSEATLRARVLQVLAQDERVLQVDATVEFTPAGLTVSFEGEGTTGPFSGVLAIDAVTATFLSGE